MMAKVKKILSFLLVLTLFLSVSLEITVKATAATGLPGKPLLQHDQYTGDIDGNYNIFVSMWYGNNCTSYKLYEKLNMEGEYKVLKEDKMNDNTPNPQNFTIPITGKTLKGIYYYYIEFKNEFGSVKSDEISIPVGIVLEEKNKIVISGIDDIRSVNQFTINEGKNSFKLSNSDSRKANFTVIANNTSTVKASIVNGDTLQVEGISAGRSGLKLKDNTTGLERYVGVRVKNKDGSLPGMPNYVSLGQVSEDIQGDLEFWRDMDTDETNKRCDIRYIYVNGGPINGWRSWNPSDDGGRVKSYIKESLKLGMIPYFVYYNIPDSAEDYGRDLMHVNDKNYMEAYYKDLQFFLDICKEYGGDEKIGIILEPDFLGYMMQQNGNSATKIEAKGVEGAYTSGVLEKGKDPEFQNTIEGVVKSINYIINKSAPNYDFGWQFNTWSYAKEGVPSQGLMHATEYKGWNEGRDFIKKAAEETAKYYMESGILSYGADFISIDKYGFDGAYQSGAAENPKNSNWFWNGDLWNNYLLYTKALHETTKKPVTLWQLPVGHINSSQEPNPYNSSLFGDLDNSVKHYEDSAPSYFFGDTFKPGSGNRYNYFSTNLAMDQKVNSNGNTVTYGSHIEEAKNAGVTTMLFGAGVGDSTDAVGNPPTENYWWITKAQRYYKNPVYIDNIEDGKEKEDINNDGIINSLDLSIIASLYNCTSENINWLDKADVNKDGIIDIFDLILVSRRL